MTAHLTGSWSWGFNGSTPGPVYHARYGEPILVRRHNNLPPIGVSNVNFALPSTTSHLHNGHTASESDGSRRTGSTRASSGTTTTPTSRRATTRARS